MADIAQLGIEVLSDDIVKATKRLDKLENQSKKTEKSNDGLSKSFKAVGGVVAAIGLTSLIKDVVGTAAAFEKMEASLITVTGSMEKAKSAMSGIAQFATSTPYQVGEITDAFIKLKALGIAPTEENLKSFGNTSSAMGKSLNQMIEAVADAATGEFERLKEFGIKSQSEGDKVKFTFQGVTTEVGKNSDEITKYLTNIGNTKFAGAMEKQMNTLDGVFSNFSDSVSLAVKKLSEDSGFNELIKDATKGVSLFIRELSGTSTLDDAKSRINTINKEIASLKKTIEDANNAKPEDRGWLDYIIGASPQAVIIDATNKIKILEAQLSTFQEKADAIKKGAGSISAAGAGTPLTSAELDAKASGKAFEGLGGEDSLSKLQQKYMSEQQLLTDKYNIEQELLVASLDAKRLTEEEYANLSFESDKLYSEKSVLLTQQEEERKRMLRMQGVKYAGAIADNLSTLMSSKNKQLFEIGKIAATASALINTYEAITKTMALVPYPWNIPLAAAQGIAGMVQVQNIRSQSFSGGGSGSVSVTGGGGAAAGFSGGGALPPPTPAPDLQGGSKFKEIRVVVDGDSPHSESMRKFIKNLEKTAADMGSDTRLVLS